MEWEEFLWWCRETMDVYLTLKGGDPLGNADV